MSQIAFHFFRHTGKTVIAFRSSGITVILSKKQWYNAVTPRDPRTTPLHTRQLKEDNGRTKSNAESYGVREGSPVEVQWAVRCVGDDLWWERFVEQVSF